MRFVLAYFVTILVVSWASCGQAGVITESTGAGKSVKEIATSSESHNVPVQTGSKKSVKEMAKSFQNPKPDTDKKDSLLKNKKPMQAIGNTSVKKIASSFEVPVETVSESPKTELPPEIPEIVKAEAEIEAVVNDGKKFEETHPICNIDPASEVSQKPWWLSLCIP